MRLLPISLAVTVALLSGSPAQAAQARVASVAAWINAQPVALCFPELLPPRLLSIPGSPSTEERQLPSNALREDAGFGTIITRVPPSMRDRLIYSNVRGEKIYAGYDGSTRAAAIVNDFVEEISRLVVGDVSVPPAAVRHGPLGLAINSGITLGSSRERVETYFNAFLRHHGSLVRVSRCNLTAESYASLPFHFVFVFRADALIAYSIDVVA